MPAMPVAERMTAEEFLALPPREEAARTELVNGELVVSEASPFHATLQGRIFFTLELWVRAEPGRGRAFFPIDVGIDEHSVYIPDVLWYAEGRAPGNEDRPSPPPDLAVEVRQARRRRGTVFIPRSAAFGVPEHVGDVDAVLVDSNIDREEGAATSRLGAHPQLEREEDPALQRRVERGRLAHDQLTVDQLGPRRFLSGRQGEELLGRHALGDGHRRHRSPPLMVSVRCRLHGWRREIRSLAPAASFDSDVRSRRIRRPPARGAHRGRRSRAAAQPSAGRDPGLLAKPRRDA